MIDYVIIVRTDYGMEIVGEYDIDNHRVFLAENALVDALDYIIKERIAQREWYGRQDRLEREAAQACKEGKFEEFLLIHEEDANEVNCITKNGKILINTRVRAKLKTRAQFNDEQAREQEKEK